MDAARCREHVAAIASALPPGRRLQVGAEDHARAQAVRDCVIAAAEAGLADRLGATVPANMRRSPEDLDRLAASGVHTVDEHELPGRQGRLALALLCLERRRPVAVDRLASLLWRDALPPDPGGAVASIVSKLRAAFRRAGDDGPGVIAAGAGTYQLRLSAGSSVDLEDARNGIDRAEGARRGGDAAAAWSFATVAVAIGGRGFLPGESGDWVLTVQRELERTTRRGYACLAWVWTERGDGTLRPRWPSWRSPSSRCTNRRGAS